MTDKTISFVAGDMLSLYVIKGVIWHRCDPALCTNHVIDTAADTGVIIYHIFDFFRFLGTQPVHLTALFIVPPVSELADFHLTGYVRNDRRAIEQNLSKNLRAGLKVSFKKL